MQDQTGFLFPPATGGILESTIFINFKTPPDTTARIS